MIKLTKENTVKAISRSKELKPVVRFVSDRVFTVSSSRNANVYRVQLFLINGEKFGQCTCKANERGLVCYHITSAVSVNFYRQSLKVKMVQTMSKDEMKNSLYCKPQPVSEKINGFRV